MKFTVSVMEFHGDDDATREGHSRATWHVYTNVNRVKATKICLRHAKRGVKRFGGKINVGNWGIRGGMFPDSYRSAHIVPE